MARRWIKGNTHTHTTYSDGDSPPEVVVDWYAARDYDFLFLTDHNAWIPDEHFERLRRDGLALWQGEEVSMAAVHVNGLGLQELVAPPQKWWVKSALEPEVADSREERIRWALEQIQAQGGVATVNHPNYKWALSAEILLASGEFRLLEVANAHPEVGNEGDADHPSTEELWDRLLTAGRQVWGVASDDAHHFQTWGPDRSNPGRGWLRVEAAEPRLDLILQALRDGRFYASSGLELGDYRATPREVALDLASGTARIELIGAEGRILESVEGAGARFDLTRHRSPYARVRATDDGGRRLWTQPVLR